jgi:uncharacterized protein YfcZ (UPF0381/DUF406 family)
MGYFYPASPAEAEECLRQMSNRAKHTFQSLAHIKYGIEKNFGKQIELDLKEVSSL